MKLTYTDRLVLAIAFLLGALLVLVVPAHSRGFHHAQTMVLANDMGGLISAYEQRYIRAARSGARAVIDGDCLSACTMAIGIFRGRICAAPNAVLGFRSAWEPWPCGKVPAPPGTRQIARHFTREAMTWVEGHEPCDHHPGNGQETDMRELAHSPARHTGTAAFSFGPVRQIMFGVSPPANNHTEARGCLGVLFPPKERNMSNTPETIVETAPHGHELAAASAGRPAGTRARGSRGTNVHPELESDKSKALALMLRAARFPLHRIALLWDCGDERVAEVIGTPREEEGD